jgi:hypothetical protein
LKSLWDLAVIIVVAAGTYALLVMIIDALLVH